MKHTKYGNNLSAKYTNAAPKTKPRATGTNAHLPSLPYTPEVSAISIAGAKSDQYDAASITWARITNREYNTLFPKSTCT